MTTFGEFYRLTCPIIQRSNVVIKFAKTDFGIIVKQTYLQHSDGAWKNHGPSTRDTASPWWWSHQHWKRSLLWPTWTWACFNFLLRTGSQNRWHVASIIACVATAAMFAETCCRLATPALNTSIKNLHLHPPHQQLHVRIAECFLKLEYLVVVLKFVCK